jgi:HAD superfamily hydrolase (TIGR01459 family)
MLYWLSFLTSLLFITGNIYSEGTRTSEIILDSQNAGIPTLSLQDLSNRYDAFLLDAYGVFWGSSEVGVLPGAAAAMKYLVDSGKQVGILSNSTQLASKEREKLKKHGLHEGVHYHFILTSGEIARELLQKEDLPFSTPHSTYWVFGTIHPRFGSHLQLFEGTQYQETENLEEADFIYISIPHIDGVDQQDPEVFRQMIQSTLKQKPVLCVNPDRFAMEGSPPRLAVRQGSIGRMFEEEGFSVYFIGKPSQIIYEAALKRFSSHLSKERILMIGDTPETDIRGAYQAGLNAALVTKTGVMANLIEKDGMAVIHRLPLSDQPQFLLERLHK